MATLATLIALPFLLTVVYAAFPPPRSALMVLRQISGEEVDYRWRGLSQISPNLVAAVATSEDAKLCEHHGVDWAVLHDIVSKAVLKGAPPKHGGSTIAMQTAKNLFLWPEKSYVRKAIEIPLALWIDLVWTKNRLMEVYLNIAEWGPGIYGAEAASQHYFGKPASRLSLNEASLLAVSLPSPLTRNARNPNAKLKRLSGRLLRKIGPTQPFLRCLRT